MKTLYEVRFRAFDEDCDGTHYDRYERRVFDSKGEAWLFFETKSLEDEATIWERNIERGIWVEQTNNNE